ncbi:hypothetical protein GCM10027072_53220 [Streptomyces bullii]
MPCPAGGEGRPGNATSVPFASHFCHKITTRAPDALRHPDAWFRPPFAGFRFAVPTGRTGSSEMPKEKGDQYPAYVIPFRVARRGNCTRPRKCTGVARKGRIRPLSERAAARASWRELAGTCGAGFGGPGTR